MKKKLPRLEQLFALFGNPELVLSLDVVHADLNSLHVQRDGLVGACNPPCLPFNGVRGIQEAHIGNT